mgnify:FL=1
MQNVQESSPTEKCHLGGKWDENEASCIFGQLLGGRGTVVHLQNKTECLEVHILVDFKPGARFT